MPKNLLFITSLSVILFTAYLVYALNSESRSRLNYVPGRKSEMDTIVNQAKYIFRIEKERGVDFSRGPCLTNALVPGWVLDIVHKPRQQIDDLPQNQCPSYLEGKTMHFIELDTDGNFVRAK